MENLASNEMSSSRPTLVVVRDESDPSQDCLLDLANLARFQVVADSGLAEVIDEAEILFVWPFRVPTLRSAWERAVKLRWIHTATAGVDGLIFKELQMSDVAVTNSRGVFEVAIAEYTLGLLLAFAKDLHTTLRLQDQRRWLHRETAGLQGAQLLVVGAGPIGREVGILAKHFGMAVEIIARHRRENDPTWGLVRGIDELHAALGRADYVVVATPLTQETKGLINAAAIDAMKPGARIINVGRGAVLDERAVLAGLESNHLGGAALDVFEEEPLPLDHPFWSRSDVIVSPHMSADLVGWQRMVTAGFAENLRRFRAGEELLNRVDKQSGYGMSRVASSGSRET